MSDERPRLPYVSRKGHLKMIKLLFYPFLARPASVFFPTNHDFHCFPPDRMPPSAVTVGHAAIAGRYPAMPATIPNQPCQLPPRCSPEIGPQSQPLVHGRRLCAAISFPFSGPPPLPSWLPSWSSCHCGPNATDADRCRRRRPPPHFLPFTFREQFRPTEAPILYRPRHSPDPIGRR